MHTEPNVNFSVVILDILPFQFSMKNLRLCKHAHMMAHLPRPATQWTATQQPGSSRNLVFSKLNQLLTTSAGGGLPSSNCQSYKHRPVLSGVRNDSHKNTKCQSYKERPVLTRCKSLPIMLTNVSYLLKLNTIKDSFKQRHLNLHVLML